MLPLWLGDYYINSFYARAKPVLYCYLLFTPTLGSLGISTIRLRCFPPHSLLILVYRFLTAIGKDYEGRIDGDVWPGSAVVGANILAIVIVIMSGSWIRGKCCSSKKLKHGARNLR